MIEVKIGEGSGAKVFRAEVKALYQPPVTAVSRTIDGDDYYIGIGPENKGKMYLVELFDRTFKVIHTKIHKRNQRTKGGPVLLNQF